MSTKTNIHRKSDVGVQNVVEKVSVQADTKRRQTIADITTKENVSTGTIASASASESVAIEARQKRSSMSSPFKHHHTPVALGAAASYYFKGVPKTPVQKMIRSEQQKLLLQASMRGEDEDNTGSILANQSYLSSSSSSGGRNSSREETEVLNTSVLSDTTELTASNFLVLAGTHRTTAEDLKKIAEERRKPLSTISTTSSVEELVVHKSKRRQSVPEGIVCDKPNEEKNLVPRRRETLATVPPPRAAASPIELPSLVPKIQRSQQRERNKVADYQRRLSDSSFSTNAVPNAASRRRSSIAPTRELDATTELSISSSDMKKLLSKSIENEAHSQNENVSVVDVPVPLTLDEEHASDSIDKVQDSSRHMNVQNVQESSTLNKSDDDYLSPTRKSSKGPLQKSPSSKIEPYMDPFALSPARNTRSATKNAAASNKSTLSEKALFQSPTKASRRRTPTKSSQTKPDTLTLENRLHLSPAKSTRSATKKLLHESLFDEMSFQQDRSHTDDTSKNIADILNGVDPIMNNEMVNSNTTASFGDLLNDMIPADEGRLDTSVTPTARNTRSAQQERTQSISFLVDANSSSPARNTRSAHSKKQVVSPSRDDTAQMLLDLAAGSFKPLSKVDTTSTSPKSTPVNQASDTYDVDILNDLVKQYSTTKFVEKDNESSTRNVDTSQESTISLNDLLSDYLPQSQTQPSVASEDENKSFASSIFVQSAVSKASTIDTPQGMTDHEPYSGLCVQSVPNSPPSTIRFSSAEDSFVGAAAYAGQSPLRKALTPSRLAPSPRRFIHSSSKARSPFKSALTPSRLPASPYRLSNPPGGTGIQSAKRKSVTPTKLQASPLRPKRSLDNTAADEDEPTSAVKRHKTFVELQGLAKDSLVPKKVEPNSVSHHALLQSALRRPGQGSARSVMKRVAFRSPTFAEFNKLSPAENVTPMIIRRPSFTDKMYDDTNEIEVDMQTLMNNNPNFVQGAGSTPGAKRSFKGMDSIDDSNMSFDSMTIPVAENEPTMTLESDMFSVLQDVAQVKTLKVQEIPIQSEEENTIELETDINALLNVPTMLNEESIHVGRRSLIFDDEPTVELESDINLLLPDDPIGNSATKPPIESRRFNIFPSRRLSISLDGSFNHTNSEDSAVVTILHNDEFINDEIPTKATFNLKIREIVDYSSIRSMLVSSKKDFLVKVENAMRKNGISDTMAAFTAQVLQMIESQTDPEIEPNSVLEINEENISLFLALQSYCRSKNNGEFSELKKMLASSLDDFDKFEWLQWLVSATEQLSRPLDDKSTELADEIKHLDEVCIDTEQSLASVTNKSVLMARKKDTEKREVSCLHTIIWIEVTQLTIF